MIVRFLAAAEAELDQAVAYYESQFPALGSEFLLQVRIAVQRIEEFPNAWQTLGRRVRRYRLPRFPYGLVYAILDAEIIIVAVMHLHRAPDYWHGRLMTP